MEVLSYRLGELQACCYLVVKDTACIIIDPADEAAFLLEEIQRRNLDLVAMIATHGHFDHTMAAGEIQLSTQAPFYLQSSDMFLIRRMRETARYFLGYKPPIIQPRLVESLSEGTFCLSDFFEFFVIKTPGHTPGSCCLYLKDEQMLFTGDTLFKNAVGRYDFSYSSKRELKRSLGKISKLPRDTVIYPGHGEITTIRESGLPQQEALLARF